jgi:hypothetical protein
MKNQSSNEAEKKNGRPKIKKEDKKTGKIMLNLTDSQKHQIEKIATSEGLSLSQVCIGALRQCGYIKFTQDSGN